jgi:hypothetical protein
MKYLGKNPTTHVGQIAERITDVAGVGTDLALDYFFSSTYIVMINNLAMSGNAQNGGKSVLIVHPVEIVPPFDKDKEK